MDVCEIHPASINCTNAPRGEQGDLCSDSRICIIRFIVLFTLIWIILYTFNPRFVHQTEWRPDIGSCDEDHCDVDELPDPIKVFITALIVSLLISIVFWMIVSPREGYVVSGLGLGIMGFILLLVFIWVMLVSFAPTFVKKIEKGEKKPSDCSSADPARAFVAALIAALFLIVVFWMLTSCK